MFLRIACCLIAGFAVNAWPATTQPLSYVVANLDSTATLVRVWPDGSSATIATGLAALSLYVEPDGNIAVGTSDTVYRVAMPGGTATQIARAPDGSLWSRITEDASGNILAVDHGLHAVWRMAHDGTGAKVVANYPVQNQSSTEDVVITVDGSGNYIVANDNSGVTTLCSITPAGGVTPISLSGGTPNGVTGLALDGAGNYLLGSYADESIYRITPAGVATLVAQDAINLFPMQGLARDPFTGEILVAIDSGKLVKVSPDGSVVTTLAASPAIPSAYGVAVDASSLKASGGAAADPSGDALGGTNPPDLIEATVIPAYPNVKIRVRFANFDPAASAANFYLDTDQNASTGATGTGYTADAGLIGAEYTVLLAPGFGGLAQISQCAPGCTVVGTTPVTALTDGWTTVIPLSLLGNATGRLKFKAVAETSLGGGNFSTTDDDPDPGVAPYSSVTPGIATRVGVYNSSGWKMDSNGNGTYDSGTDETSAFVLAGATPVYGDWNGDGRTKTGFYIDGFWYLDYDGNGTWDGGVNDKQYAFGWPDSCVTPVVGDWNGDGRTKIGVYCDGFWFLDYNGNGVWEPDTDKAYIFGWNATGVMPVVGDWDGDGTSKIGIYYKGFWYLDYNGNGVWEPGADKAYNFGWDASGVTPIFGDWNGDGTAKIGIYYQGFWYLDYNGNGVWEPDADKTYIFGAGMTPLVADWSGDGRDKIGVFSNGYWYLDLNGNGTFDAHTDYVYQFGGAGDAPVVGKW
jgi:hypothetical protein